MLRRRHYRSAFGHIRLDRSLSRSCRSGASTLSSLTIGIDQAATGADVRSREGPEARSEALATFDDAHVAAALAAGGRLADGTQARTDGRSLRPRTMSSTLRHDRISRTATANEGLK